ncbi:MAG: valine--pyruvate transaminase [Lentisphaerae bacterium]|nr:valine--pyruvate transaminase [Lentisphaerota bacterium]
MQFKLSAFGDRYATPSGITALMDDLGRAMSGHTDMFMLGGGNPAHIPAVEAVWRQRIGEILADGRAFDTMLGDYDTPQGNTGFLDDVVAFLNRRYGWGISVDNVAITNGAQTALFCLMNFFSGPAVDGKQRRVLFPLMPEYIGYADQALDPKAYTARLPRIEECDDGHTFKYHIDFDTLELSNEIGAVCISRPCNPTGNVLSDGEVAELANRTAARNIPLIVDNAYGAPFPGILFTEATPPWGEHTILTFSLSKLGLPSTRTGIVVGPTQIISALTSMNSVLSLASGGIGQAVVRPLLRNDAILDLCRESIRPFYEAKSLQAQAWIREAFGNDIDYRVHKSEGALFLWVWLKGLPIPARKLYERLKARGVLIVPGEFFVFGLDAPWPHASECFRMTYSQADHHVKAGIDLIADEVRRVYRGAPAV